MSRLMVVERSGDERDFEASSGLSVMENIRDQGIDELVAQCTCQIEMHDAPDGLRVKIAPEG